jgi:hypothetical protein
MLTHENQILFCKIVALLELTELPPFKTSSEQFWRNHYLRLPEFSRGGTHLLLGFIFAQFEVM